jgi:FAD binding domain/D-arabinono-1,4-lactone oxidase
MPNSVTNYDGSITATPQQLVYPTTVEELQAILRNSAQYPAPVRGMGSYHSLTPCASSQGTIVNMSKMTQVIAIDDVKMTMTAQAGLQVVDAAAALRAHKLQLMTNIEIGNMRLGSAATCHTKDGLDGIEFGQFNSYVTAIKWVTPDGDLAAVTEDNPDLLRIVRSSYGLMGIVYEVTLRVKPIEVLHFTYLPRPLDQIQQSEVDSIIASSEGLVCWTVGRTSVFQQRHKVNSSGILGTLMADVRRKLWSFTGAHTEQFIDNFFSDPKVRNAIQQGAFDIEKALYESLHLLGGITILAPDKIINYEDTPPSARYAFTFWAFPRSEWLANLRAYVDFADAYFKKTGFRCNMPLGSYFIRADTNSLLSSSYNGDVFSIDPIHAVTDVTAWHTFLAAFNDFASQRNGIPLLNQSPLVERKHVEAAYGARWTQLSTWTRTMDPKGRMLNPFFADLLS